MCGKSFTLGFLEGHTSTLPTKVEATPAPSDPPLPNPVSLWFVCMSVSLLYTHTHTHTHTHEKQEREIQTFLSTPDLRS